MHVPRWVRGAAAVGALGLTLGTLSADPASAAPDVVTIAEVQGTGDASPLVGQEVRVENVHVTAKYGSENGGFKGFTVQTSGTGGDKSSGASDAVFVYAPNGAGPNYDRLAVGDTITITSGTVKEFRGLTEIEISGNRAIQPSSRAGAKPTPVTTAWTSLDTDAKRESVESMLYAGTTEYVIADNYGLDKYGELGLAVGEAPVQPTDVGAPGSDAAAAQQAKNKKISVALDDGTGQGYARTAELEGRTLPYLRDGAKNGEGRAAVGDTVKLDEPVILDYRNNKWTFEPTTPVKAGSEPATITAGKAPSAPQVGGDFTVGSFNVLNYFTTTGSGKDGCTGENLSADGSFNITYDCDYRGAWDGEDLKRQQEKIVTAINKLDASVTGLMEIENSAKLGEDTDEALKTLVAALNSAAGETKWAAVESSKQLQDVADQDVITSALIYQPAKVQLNGEAYALGAEAGADGAFSNARTPIAATFTPKAGGAPTLVSVNHFKSKGSGPKDGPDADSGDGQGAWNATRVAQAKALAAWIPEVQKESGAEAVALIGDFNSYTKEDPMAALAEAGYANAAKADEYSYNYSGLEGSLDHVLLNKAAQALFTGSKVWDINANQSTAYEYSQYSRTKVNYHAADEFRSSDHDPVVVGLKADKGSTSELTLINFNDFHGRIATESPDTVAFFGTIEEERAKAGEENTAVLSAGDSIGASLFASSSQEDKPTIDVLNAADLDASAVGNHEFDRGFADLTGRVSDAAQWTYLGANVYKKGTTKPALPEYKIIERAGKKIGVVGAVTEETRSLVSPAGVADLDFGDPVEAVNRVTKQLTDGNADNGEADIVIAEYHDGAVEGEPNSTLADEVAKGGAFAKIVNETDPKVAAIFTAHTHKEYVWDAPLPGDVNKTRPLVQSASYGALIGKVVLTIDDKTGEVTAAKAENIPVTKTPQAELVKTYPRAAEIKKIVDAALAEAEEIGGEVIGEATAPITRAYTTDADGKPLEDRASESAVSNLVANMLRDQTSEANRGGATIGVQNPGGNRADIEAGDITLAEAAAVLPFANTLYTSTLTGDQFKTLLEQQWQTNEDGSPFTGSRPYLQLGLSDNVSYTYDADKPWGERITSIMIDGKPYDPNAEYRVAAASFLAAGGDNFHVFKKGKDTKDSGLIDLDAWVDYVKAKTPITPDFAKRGTSVKPLPTELKAGEATELKVSGLDQTSTGAVKSTKLDAALGAPAKAMTTKRATTAAEGSIGTAEVTDGEATITVTVPADQAAGDTVLVLTAEGSGTTITIPVKVVAAAEEPAPSEDPSPSEDPTGSPSEGSDDGSGEGSGDGNSSGADEGNLPGDPLADTGAQSGLLGLGALALVLVAGGGTLLVARRR